MHKGLLYGSGGDGGAIKSSETHRKLQGVGHDFFNDALLGLCEMHKSMRYVRYASSAVDVAKSVALFIEI
ncbi:hypothetical protein HMPREF3149_01245 [Corynebacterium sp. HMSC05E07]|nr:hypothetical protein HMPREF3149_01245 [Corynebacterium sp. HMSC05E07]